MVDLFRKLLLVLCDFVYSGIPGLYKTFYALASAELFSADEIQKFASNIYILISVIMLFAFGVKLIEAIVNPDLLADTKKGTAGVFKRAIIALGLIVFIPYGFNKIYDIQSSFLNSNFFERLIIGNTSINNYSNSNCSDVSAGQIMAGTALHQFLYPEDYSNVVITEENQSIAEEYNEIMVCNISKLGDFGDVINEKDGSKYTFHFDGLFALGAGLFLIYELVILCIDTALRLVKLGFLQLIAPIIVSAYIFTGTDNLVKYLKEVGSTFAEIFARVAAFAFYILVLSKIESVIGSIDSAVGKWGTIFFLIGALQFVKLVPNLLGSLFGMNIQNRGGIKGRLGEMAGVGGLAQKAWGAVRGLSGAALAAPLAAAGFGLGKGIGFLGNRVGSGMNTLTNNKFKGLGHNLAGGLSAGKSMIKGAAGSGGFIKGISGAKKGLKDNNFYKEKMFDRNAKKDVEKHKKYNLNNATGKRDVPKDENDVGDTLQKVVNDQNELMKDINKDSKLTSTESSVTSTLISDKNDKGKIDKVIKNMDSIESIVDRARTLSGDSKKAEEIQKAFAAFKDNVNDKDALSKLKLQIKENASGTDANTVVDLATKAQKLLTDEKIKGEIEKLNGGKLGVASLTSLKTFSTNMDGIVKTSQAKFDDVKGRSSNSNLMETYASIGEDLSNAYIYQFSKQDSSNNATNSGTTSSQSQTNTNTSSSSNNTTNRGTTANNNTTNNTNTSSNNGSTISYNVSPEGVVTTSGGILLTGSAADEVLKSRNRNNNTTNNTNNSGSNGTTASNTAGGTTVINNNYENNPSSSNMNNNDDVINKLNDINNSIIAGTSANVAASTAAAESIINNDKDMSRQQQNRDKIRDQVVKEESDETQSKIDEIITKNKE